MTIKKKIDIFILLPDIKIYTKIKILNVSIFTINDFNSYKNIFCPFINF